MASWGLMSLHITTCKQESYGWPGSLSQPTVTNASGPATPATCRVLAVTDCKLSSLHAEKISRTWPRDALRPYAEKLLLRVRQE